MLICQYIPAAWLCLSTLQVKSETWLTQRKYKNRVDGETGEGRTVGDDEADFSVGGRGWHAFTQTTGEQCVFFASGIHLPTQRFYKKKCKNELGAL